MLVIPMVCIATVEAVVVAAVVIVVVVVVVVAVVVDLVVVVRTPNMQSFPDPDGE